MKLDELDRRILEQLMKDARKPYLDIARQCKVSGAAIHQRIHRMKEAGVFRGSRLELDQRGWDI